MKYKSVEDVYQEISEKKVIPPVIESILTKRECELLRLKFIEQGNSWYQCGKKMGTCVSLPYQTRRQVELKIKEYMLEGQK